MNSKILLSTHSEVYVIDCSTLLYLQAEDHYTHLYTAQGGHMLLPFALSQVVEALSGPVSRGLRLYRMGRTYVLNLRYVAMYPRSSRASSSPTIRARSICSASPRSCSVPWSMSCPAAVPKAPLTRKNRLSLPTYRPEDNHRSARRVPSRSNPKVSRKDVAGAFPPSSFSPPLPRTYSTIGRGRLPSDHARPFQSM